VLDVRGRSVFSAFAHSSGPSFEENGYVSSSAHAGRRSVSPREPAWGTWEGPGAAKMELSPTRELNFLQLAKRQGNVTRVKTALSCRRERKNGRMAP